MGCLFSYYVTIPYTLDFLDQYGQAINVLTFFEITPFILFVVNMMLIFGFAFQLPIVMWALTKTRIVNTNFWKDNLRYVVIFLVILVYYNSGWKWNNHVVCSRTINAFVRYRNNNNSDRLANFKI